jgi:hypothetical protein
MKKAEILINTYCYNFLTLKFILLWVVWLALKKDWKTLSWQRSDSHFVNMNLKILNFAQYFHFAEINHVFQE